MHKSTTQKIPVQYIQFFYILLFSIIFFHTNLFAKQIATITILKGEASIYRSSKNLTASMGLKIEEKDIIATNNKTKLQLIFNDDTVISIGKNSKFSIQKYLFDEKSKPIAKFGLLKGTMRCLTGKIGKINPKNFTVQTKTATIGIRGTEFGVILSKNNAFQTFCTLGAIDITSNTQKHLLHAGYFMDVSHAGKVRIRKFSNNDLKIIHKTDFIQNEQFKSVLIRNSKITSKLKIQNGTIINNSNLGNEFKGKNIQIDNSKITTDAKIGKHSIIENSNIGNSFKDKNLKIINSTIITKTAIGNNAIIKNSNLGTSSKKSVNNFNSSSNVNVDNNSKIENSNLGISLEE